MAAACFAPIFRRGQTADARHQQVGTRDQWGTWLWQYSRECTSTNGLATTAVHPVALPPGRARLSTKRALTGSGTCANTIGTVRVACCTAAIGPVPEVWMTSGASAINSAAYLRARSTSAAPNR